MPIHVDDNLYWNLMNKIVHIIGLYWIQRVMETVALCFSAFKIIIARNISKKYER